MNPPIARYAEVILFSLVNYVPYLLMAIYPFKKKFRFSKSTTLFSILLLTVWEVFLEIIAMIVLPKYTQFFSILNTGVFLLCYFLLIREKLGKMVFTLMMLTNFGNFILVASTYLSSILWGSNTNTPDHWTTAVSMVIVQFFILLPLASYYKKYYAPAINAEYDAVWNYLWVIPATFYIIWYFILYYVADCSSYEMALRQSTTLFLFLTTLGSCVIYHIAIKLITTQQERLKLEQEKRLWEMTSLQFKTINNRITESRILRHDLRHQVTILQTLLADKKYDALREHLETYGKRLTYDTSCVFCENDTANIIIGFFAQEAKKLNIVFHTNVYFPNTTALDRLEVGVLLANLLENAIDACKSSSIEDKKISLNIKMIENSMLVLSIQNTSTEQPLDAEGDFFHSTKHEGVGIGLTSVRRIVEHHKGKLSINQSNCLFSLSFVLYFD